MAAVKAMFRWGEEMEIIDIPFKRFPNINIALGPEMKSTGEVMGIDSSFGAAFAKAQSAAGAGLPHSGTVFISVHDAHKGKIAGVAKAFIDLGFSLVATKGTARCLAAHDLKAETVLKVGEGRPNIVDHIKNREIQLIVNTSIGRKPSAAAYHIRKSAIAYNIPYATTIAAARASVEAIRTVRSGSSAIGSLQEHHRKNRR